MRDRSCSDPHITLIELVSKRRHDVSKLAGDFVCAGHNDVRPKRRLQPFKAIRPPAPLSGSVEQLANTCTRPLAVCLERSQGNHWPAVDAKP